MSSPTARTLDLLRKEGWVAGVVERHNTFSRKKNDYAGIIDVIAFRPTSPLQDGRTIGIQATADNGGHAAKRVAKALDEWRLLGWLSAGNAFEVWSWARRNNRVRGARKLWNVRRQPILLTDPGVCAALYRALRAAWADDASPSRRAASRAAFPPELWGPMIDPVLAA